MKITILVENTKIPDSDVIAEEGFCAYIEADGISILFDTGLSGIFFKNAQKLGLTLQPDYLILSHGHRDHTGGLTEIIKNPFDPHPVCIGHPDLFLPKIKGTEEFGSPVSKEAVSSVLKLRLSEKPVWISDNFVFLGEIPRCHLHEPVEGGRKRIKNGIPETDTLPDDSALVYIAEDGLVIISGCAHSGICNITDYAAEITGIKKISAIIGGLHLYGANQQRIDETIRFLKEKEISELYICHCTGPDAIRSFTGSLPVRPCGCGSVILL